MTFDTVSHSQTTKCQQYSLHSVSQIPEYTKDRDNQGTKEKLCVRERRGEEERQRAHKAAQKSTRECVRVRANESKKESEREKESKRESKKMCKRAREKERERVSKTE